MTTIDKQRIAAVEALTAFGCEWNGSQWTMPPTASMSPDSQILQALLEAGWLAPEFRTTYERMGDRLRDHLINHALAENPDLHMTTAGHAVETWDTQTYYIDRCIEAERKAKASGENTDTSIT